MLIKTLAENTSVSDCFGAEHGLCLYLETKRHKLLFDTGRTDLFVRTAELLEADLTEVDTVILSHGHYDHGGGLSRFLQLNQKAKIYIQEKAFSDYYSIHADGNAYIGLDKTLQNNERICLTKDFLHIDEELTLFSDVTGKELLSLSNQTLLMEKAGAFVQDTFEHEQNLVITENGTTVLFAGCAHNGIVNITEHFHQRYKAYADIVIGGFHLFNPSTKKSESPELIQKISERLKTTGSVYYTCHCTGLFAYAQLKELLGAQIEYLATGSILDTIKIMKEKQNHE